MKIKTFLKNTNYKINIQNIKTIEYIVVRQNHNLQQVNGEIMKIMKNLEFKKEEDKNFNGKNQILVMIWDL